MLKLIDKKIFAILPHKFYLHLWIMIKNIFCTQPNADQLEKKVNIARNIQIEAKKKAKEVAASERGTPNSTSRQSKYSTVNFIIVWLWETGLQIYGGPGSLSHDFKVWPITFQGSRPSGPIFFSCEKISL